MIVTLFAIMTPVVTDLVIIIIHAKSLRFQVVLKEVELHIQLVVLRMQHQHATSQPKQDRKVLTKYMHQQTPRSQHRVCLMVHVVHANWPVVSSRLKTAVMYLRPTHQYLDPKLEPLSLILEKSLSQQMGIFHWEKIRISKSVATIASCLKKYRSL